MPTFSDAHDNTREDRGDDGRDDGRDGALHANLHAIGEQIGYVPAPSAAQLKGWRSGAGATETATGAEVSGPRLVRASGGALGRNTPHARRSRWLAAGSAIAACIAIGAVVLIQPWGGMVQASTIIENLRSRQFGGANIRFDRVSSRGTTVDGEVRVRLDRPVSIDTLDDARALKGDDHFGAAYGRFIVTTDDSVPGWGGGRIEAEGALTHGSGWMYVRASDQTVGQIAGAEPRAMGLARMAGTGVLLNVGGVDESFFEGLNALMCPVRSEHAIGASGLRASGAPTPDGRHRVSIGVATGITGDGAGAPSAEQMQRLTGLARMVLSGKARQGELDQLRRMIQDDFSQKATVRSQGGGRYLLTAELPGADGSSTPEATLTVSYEEQGGVQWGELSNMRGATGTIRIDFVSDPIDPALLAYERLVQTGTTNYVDLRMIMRMFMPGPAR